MLAVCTAIGSRRHIFRPVVANRSMFARRTRLLTAPSGCGRHRRVGDHAAGVAGVELSPARALHPSRKSSAHRGRHGVTTVNGVVRVVDRAANRSVARPRDGGSVCYRPSDPAVTTGQPVAMMVAVSFAAGLNLTPRSRRLGCSRERTCWRRCPRIAPNEGSSVRAFCCFSLSSSPTRFRSSIRLECCPHVREIPAAALLAWNGLSLSPRSGDGGDRRRRHCLHRTRRKAGDARGNDVA